MQIVKFANQLALRWGVILGYLGGPGVMIRVLMSEREKRGVRVKEGGGKQRLE